MTTTLIQRLHDESDQAKQDGANDIAALIDEAIAALSQPVAQAEQAWQPIETAPKDMLLHLFRVNGVAVEAFRDAIGQLLVLSDRRDWRPMRGTPMHWMPLPAAPDRQAAQPPAEPAALLAKLDEAMSPEGIERTWNSPMTGFQGSARTAEPAAQPAGWRMVPVEPTVEMRAAAVRFANGSAVYKNVTPDVLKIEEDIYGEVFSAMLAAAPQPKEPEPEPEPEMTDCPHGVPHRWSCGECDAPPAAAPQPATDVDPGDLVGKFGPLPETGWDEVPAREMASPTSGMSIEQRILHVGGRNNAAGYVEFGSVQAVQALVRQVLRDLPRHEPLTEILAKALFDELSTAVAGHDSPFEMFVWIARAVEQAHGIGGK